MYSKQIEDMISDEREKLIIDIREESEFNKVSYPGSINIPDKDFENRKDILKKDIPIYIICYTGKRSFEICEDLGPEGYEIYSIDSGIYSYYKYQVMNRIADDEASEKVCRDIEESITGKFGDDIWGPFVKAIDTYEMIKEGDKIAVCISGGKDSMLMAKLFQEYKKRSALNFDVVYLVMNPGYNRINYETILNNAKMMKVPITVFDSDIFDIVDASGGSPCYLCARMRRGTLYSKAEEYGCNKIALGHHYDDAIETILMGLLYGGQVQTMMPKLHSTNFTGMELIRPLYLIREESIKAWRDYNKLTFINCACRLTESCASCGGTEKGSKRAEVKSLIASLKKRYPDLEDSIFKSVDNVNLDKVISYKDLDGTRKRFSEN